MVYKWIKVAVPVENVEPEEAACSLAAYFNRAVEVVEGENGTAILVAWVEKKGFNGDIATEAVNSIRADFPDAVAGEPVLETVEEQDWLAGWKKSVKPLAVGESIIIVPSWWDKPFDDGRTPIILDPGMAFGTGHHATTAGCMTMLERYRGANVLDIGCGSGILAIAAAKLGAKQVLGLDNDPEVIPVAQENVKLNNVDRTVEIREDEIGSIDNVFDVVVANLYLGPLVQIAPVAAKILSPRCVFIASGITSDQVSQACTAFSSAGMSALDRLEKNGWVTLAYRKE